MSPPNDYSSPNKWSGSYFCNDHFFVKLFHNSPSPKSLSNLSNRKLVDVNEAWEHFTGLSKDNVIGFKVEDLNIINTEKADQIRDLLELEKNVKAFEVELKVNNDEKKYAIASFQFLKIDGNDFVETTLLDVTDLKKTNNDLRLSKEFNEKLIMSMQEGLIIFDLKGNIVMVNDSVCEILGYSKLEFQMFLQPYPFISLKDFKKLIKSNYESPKGFQQSFKFELVKKNGIKFQSSFLTGSVKNNNGKVIAFFTTIKDISDELKVQNTLETIAKKSILKKEVILELSGLVGSDYNQALTKITSLSSKALNVGRVSVWKFNEDRSEIKCEKGFSLNTGKFKEGMILKRSDNFKYFETLDENKTISVNDVFNDDITKGFSENYLKQFRITSMLDVFINANNGTYGILCFENIDRPRAWTAEEQEFASSIASIVSLMVENTERRQLEKQLIQANKQLSLSNIELNDLKKQLEQENFYLKKELDLVFNYEDMVYGSVEFSNVLSEVEKVAPTNATVLLQGESGTGKELLARAIHNTSLRNSKPLIKVNCSAIPRELIESELFGHKKGSFTGAISDKMGKFELADQGTLFLDEIGELPLDMQPKILRFLQEGEIETIGGTRLKKLDVRVIAATNRNLKEEIQNKRFREDLYFRLNVFPIEVPPLRKRKDDIPLLVEHFVDKFNKKYTKNILYISDYTLRHMKAYEWPGNIRELENLIERAIILANNDTLMIPGIESEAQLKKMPLTNSDLTLNEVQRNYILDVLVQCNWKINGPKGASAILDLKPSTLRDKISKLGIKRPDKK